MTYITKEEFGAFTSDLSQFLSKQEARDIEQKNTIVTLGEVIVEQKDHIVALGKVIVEQKEVIVEQKEVIVELRDGNQVLLGKVDQLQETVNENNELLKTIVRVGPKVIVDPPLGSEQPEKIEIVQAAVNEVFLDEEGNLKEEVLELLVNWAIGAYEGETYSAREIADEIGFDKDLRQAMQVFGSWIYQLGVKTGIRIQNAKIKGTRRYPLQIKPLIEATLYNYCEELDQNLLLRMR